MPNPKTAPGIPADAIAEQVDELGALDRRLAPYALDIARVEVLRKRIRVHFDASPATETFEAKGDKYVVRVGARAIQRTVDMRKLLKLIGIKRLIAFVTCTQAALEEHAPGMDVVSSAYTGARSLKLFERPGA